MTDRTTINIDKKTRKLIQSLRITSRETYDEVLERELMQKLKRKLKIKKGII